MTKLQILGTGCPKCQKMAEVAEEAAKFIWSEYPPITETSYLSEPYWLGVLGLGLGLLIVINVVAVVVLVTRRPKAG